MITGLRGVSIWSGDLKNLLPFYRDVLGLKVGFERPGFVVLGDLDAPALALGTHSEVHGRNVDSARHMVGLATDDVSTDWKRLKSAGVEFVEDPTGGEHVLTVCSATTLAIGTVAGCALHDVDRLASLRTCGST